MRKTFFTSPARSRVEVGVRASESCLGRLPRDGGDCSRRLSMRRRLAGDTSGHEPGGGGHCEWRDHIRGQVRRLSRAGWQHPGSWQDSTDECTRARWIRNKRSTGRAAAKRQGPDAQISGVHT
eukprot:scaffold51923_cov36-Tisochrysis_lutea.AAC.1